MTQKITWSDSFVTKKKDTKRIRNWEKVCEFSYTLMRYEETRIRASVDI